MDFTTSTYVCLVFAGIVFLFFLWCLVGFIAEVDLGYFVGLILAGLICAILVLTPVKTATHRHQNAVARDDLASAGYDCTKADRRHCTLQVGNCPIEFRVKKISNRYMPVVRTVADGFNHNKPFDFPLTPAFQRTRCPV